MKPIRSRLLLLRFPPEFAGGGIQASRLMAQLSSRGVDVTALSAVPEGREAPRSEDAFGGRVVRFAVPGRGVVRDAVLGLRATWWLIVHPRWDLLHLSGWSWFALLPLWLARLLGRPVLLKTTLLGESGAFDPRGGRLGARLLSAYQRVDVIVALSAALEEDLKRRPGLRARTMRIPNGVDVDLFRPARGDERDRARERYGVPPEAYVVIACGELNRRKNVADLVRAAGRTTAGPVCVLLVGPRGAEADYLAELDHAIGVLPEGIEVRILGELEPNALAEAQRAADVLALVSRAEGMPNSLLEGMATGLACVATRIPGSEDVLAAGGGRLVPLDDVQALADTLDALARDPSERCRLGAEARARVLEQYSFASVGERYADLYAALLGREPASATRHNGTESA